MSGVSKAVCLVVVVISRGKILAPALDGGVGNAVPMLDAGRSELDVIPGIGLFDSGVMSDAKTVLVRLVFHGLHDVPIDTKDLNAVDTHGLELDPRAALVRVTRRWTLVKHRINEDARSGDLVFRALLPELQCFLRVAAHVAYGCDPAGHPDFQFVVDRLRNSAALIPNVGMRVDEAGHHIFTFGVDFDIARRAAAR